jgi:hypothetical protein
MLALFLVSLTFAIECSVNPLRRSDKFYSVCSGTWNENPLLKDFNRILSYRDESLVLFDEVGPACLTYFHFWDAWFVITLDGEKFVSQAQNELWSIPEEYSTLEARSIETLLPICFIDTLRIEILWKESLSVEKFATLHQCAKRSPVLGEISKDCPELDNMEVMWCLNRYDQFQFCDSNLFNHRNPQRDLFESEFKPPFFHPPNKQQASGHFDEVIKANTEDVPGIQIIKHQFFLEPVTQKQFEFDAGTFAHALCCSSCAAPCAYEIAKGTITRFSIRQSVPAEVMLTIQLDYMQPPNVAMTLTDFFGMTDNEAHGVASLGSIRFFYSFLEIAFVNHATFILFTYEPDVEFDVTFGYRRHEPTIPLYLFALHQSEESSRRHALELGSYRGNGNIVGLLLWIEPESSCSDGYLSALESDVMFFIDGNINPQVHLLSTRFFQRVALTEEPTNDDGVKRSFFGASVMPTSPIVFANDVRSMIAHGDGNKADVRFASTLIFYANEKQLLNIVDGLTLDAAIMRDHDFRFRSNRNFNDGAFRWLAAGDLCAASKCDEAPAFIRARQGEQHLAYFAVEREERSNCHSFSFECRSRCRIQRTFVLAQHSQIAEVFLTDDDNEDEWVYAGLWSYSSWSASPFLAQDWFQLSFAKPTLQRARLHICVPPLSHWTFVEYTFHQLE